VGFKPGINNNVNYQTITMKSGLLLFLAFFIFQYHAQAQIITTVAGGGTANPGKGGSATDCVLDRPAAVALDAAGNIYICERDANRVRKVTTDGTIITIAGTGTLGYSGDGGPATAAMLYSPNCVVVDESNNVFIGDQISVIRKIDAAGNINTVAGVGTVGFSGDGGPATNAQLHVPSGLAFDADGNLLIADFENNRIRKVTASGIITTVAGTGLTEFNGNNIPATDANITPYGIATDGMGNILVASSLSCSVRKINAVGYINTIVGTSVLGFSGDLGPATDAQLFAPMGVCADNAGNILVSDTRNHRIRKIDADGNITTIAGNGLNTFAGDGGPATAASITLPMSIALDNTGSLIVCDYGNNRIRKINGVVAVKNSATRPEANMKLVPNPNTGSFTLTVPSVTNEPVYIVVMDVMGRIVQQVENTTNTTIPVIVEHGPGTYIVNAVTHSGGRCSEVVVVR
jgi:sugar lactone lactonase YvrE